MIIQSSGYVPQRQTEPSEEQKHPSLLNIAPAQEPVLQQQQQSSPPQEQAKRPTLQEAVLGQVAGGINDPMIFAEERLQVNEMQWDLISSAAAGSDNPDEYLAKYAAALTFSKEYEIPVDVALENLDSLTKELTGKPYQPNTTGVQAIVNSFKAGRLNMKFSDLAYQFKTADLKGEDTTELLMQLDEYSQAIEALQDHQPRNVVTTMLKWTAEGAVPYMIEVGKSSLVSATFAGGLGVGFQAATGVALGSLAAATPWTLAAVIGMGATVGAINRTRELMEGTSYLQLRELGIDKDIANAASRAVGIIVGAVEAGMGIEVGTVMKGIGMATGSEQLISSTASKVTAKFISSGKLGAFVNSIIALGVNATDEALEEMTEEVAEYLIRHIAYAIQETRGPLDPMPDEDIIRDTLQAGLMGFASAIVLGTGSSLLDAGITISQQSRIRHDAQVTPSKEVFVNAMEQVRPENVEVADWNNTMAEVWDKEHRGLPESSAIKSDQSAFNELDTGKGPLPRGDVRRLSDGSLYATESENVTVDTAGAEHRRMLYGDPATGSRYGYIDYAIKDNNLVIEDVLVRSGYESIRQEAVVDLIKQYPGYDVQWDAKGEVLADIRQQIIESNPRGKDAGLQYWDGLTDPSDRLVVEKQIADSMPNLSAQERSVAATLIQLRAESEGISTQAWLNENFKDGRLFGDTEVIGDVMQGKRGAVEFGQDLKAVIYAGENADFSTFAHETFHVILRQMGQNDQLRQAILDASSTSEFVTWLGEHAAIFADGLFEGKSAQELADIAATFGEDQWTRTQEEFAARLYEGYLADGKTTSPKLKQIFDQIAKWMKQIYATLSNTVDLDQRIVEVFDSLYDKDSPLAQPGIERAETQRQVASYSHAGALELGFDRTAEIISDLQEGSDITVYDVEGSPFDVTVEELSDYGSSFLARMADGKEILVDGYEYSVLEAGDPAQTVFINNKLAPVHQLETWELEQAQDLWNRYLTEAEQAGQSTHQLQRQLASMQSELDARAKDSSRGPAATLFQDKVINDSIEAMSQGTLAVLHNVSADRLVEIESIGGMPSPSLAVTRPSIPFEQFGDITLIADPSVAKMALEEGRLYDRDVWSPMVPKAEWRPKTSVIEAFDTKIKQIGQETNSRMGGSETFYSSSISGGPSSLIGEYKNNLAAQLTFLKEHGYDYELQWQKRDKMHWFPLEVMEANLDYFIDNNLTVENFEQIIEHLRPMVGEHYAADLVDGQPMTPFRESVRKRLAENSLSFNALVRTFDFAKKYDPAAIEIDTHATRDAIKTDIQKHDAEFTAWLRDNLEDAYKEPRIKIGSRMYEYNAQNILRWMNRQEEIASHEAMTFGPAKAAASAGREFFNLRDVRATEQSLVTRAEQSEAWKQRVVPLTELLQDKLPDYHKQGTWAALDSIYQAISSYIQKHGDLGDSSLMRKELSAHEFTNVPANLVQAATDLAAELMMIPQDYFEAKPNRVVSLDEFVAAVVPASITAEQRAILEGHGLTIIEYQNEADRPGIVQGLYESTQSQLLFQDDFDITGSILEEAKGFDSWQEFMDYYEAMTFGDEPIPTDTAWYVEVYNRANGISEEAVQQTAQQARAALQSEEAKDEYMRQQLSTDEGVTDFVTRLGWMLSNRALYQVGDDQAAVDAIHEIRHTAYDLVHPTIMSNALRREGGRQLTQRAIKSIRTLMTGEAIRYYRDIYANVMEDFELRPEVIDSRLPGINDPGYSALDRMSITERLKLANRIEATELKKQLLSGKETYEGSAERIVRDLDLQIQELNERITLQEEQLEEAKGRLSDRQRILYDLSAEKEETRQRLDEQLKKVRNLTDEGRQVSKKEMDATYRIQKKIDLLDKQIMQMRESERAKATVKRQDALTAQRQKLQEKARADRLVATVKRHEALAALKAELTEKQKARAEAQKVREYKLKLARRIMAKPSDAINYEQAQAIYSVQAALDPAYRRESVFLDGADGDRVRLTIDEAREFFAGSSEDDIVNALGRRMYEWLAEERRPLNDWTINDLESLAEKVGDLRAEGRRILAAQRERQQAIARQYQEAIMRSLIASGKYKSRPLVGSVQEKQDKKGPKHAARSLRYATLPMRAKALMLDGDTQGAAYDLLITQKRKAQNVEWLGIEMRQKPVIDFMKSIGLSEQDLYKSQSIALDLNTNANYTYSAMMYAYLSQFDQDNRNAVAYGNLVTQDEKAALNHDNDLIKVLGDQRYDNLIQQVEYHLDQNDGKYMQVLEQLRRDFNSQKDRLNEVAIREFNKPLRAVDEYLPIHRREFNGEDMRQQIADDLFNQNAGGLPTGVKKGFLQDRIKISPDHQRPVNMDLFQVWNNSVRQQEHFIATAEYGRKLNRVFKNRGSEDLQNVIGRTVGREMLRDVHDYMNEVINPRREVDLAGAQKAVRFMRGNLGAAYLTWKMSSIVLQAITSPAPFLQEVKPSYMVKGYMEVFAHPLKSIEWINDLSPMMKNRTMNLIIEHIMQQSKTHTDSAVLRGLYKMQEIGGMGLTLVDRYAVAGGWIGAYYQHMDMLMEQGMDQETAHRMAIDWADDITLKTQPTGDATEIAPLFIRGGEWARAFTQFTTALNVIWTNLSYDMPVAIRAAMDSSAPTSARMAQFSKVVGTIVGYGLAGAVLGAVAEGYDDDDDEMDKLRKWIYWSFTQATESVPLVGQHVDSVVRSAITGDKPDYFSDEFFPGMMKVFKGLGNIAQQDFIKALENLSQGAGYMIGLPVSGFRQLKRSILESPGAMLGR